VLYVYDVSSQKSFDRIVYWVEQYRKYAPYDTSLSILLGNKTDLYVDNHCVTENDGQRLAENLNINYFYNVSAKILTNVDVALETIFSAAYLALKPEDRIKAIFLGDAGVGKTSLLDRIKNSSVDIKEGIKTLTPPFILDSNDSSVSTSTTATTSSGSNEGVFTSVYNYLTSWFVSSSSSSSSSSSTSSSSDSSSASSSSSSSTSTSSTSSSSTSSLSFALKEDEDDTEYKKVDSENKNITEKKMDKKKSTTDLDALVILQKAEGNWELNDTFAKTIKIPLKKLKESIPKEITADYWATCLAAALLNDSSQEEMELVLEKAHQWLTENVADKVSKKEIMKTARNFLGKKS